MQFNAPDPQPMLLSAMQLRETSDRLTSTLMMTAISDDQIQTVGFVKEVIDAQNDTLAYVLNEYVELIDLVVALAAALPE